MVWAVASADCAIFCLPLNRALFALLPGHWPFLSQETSLTASVIKNPAGSAGRHVATRASGKGPGESDGEASSDGGDRGGSVAFGSDWRRLGVGNRGEWQIARAAGRKVVLRGAWRL